LFNRNAIGVRGLRIFGVDRSFRAAHAVGVGVKLPSAIQVIRDDPAAASGCCRIDALLQVISPCLQRLQIRGVIGSASNFVALPGGHDLRNGVIANREQLCVAVLDIDRHLRRHLKPFDRIAR
jgi:hypothetical protein